MKPCGTCTICCVYPSVVVTGKPLWEQCKHCDLNVGCRIYDERPTACRNFNCLWRGSDVMGDDLRPDNCGILFDAYHQDRTVIAMIGDGKEWMSDEPGKLIRQMVSDGYVVWVIEEKKGKHLLLPQGVNTDQALKMAGSAWNRAMTINEG